MENENNEETENISQGKSEESTGEKPIINEENVMMSEDNDSQEKSEEITGEKTVINEENVPIFEDNSLEENTQTIIAGNVQKNKS